MSNKLRLSIDQDAYDLENMQSSDALAYLKDPTPFHASRHLARKSVNLTNINIARVKPRTDSNGGAIFAHQSQESPDSAQRFSLMTSPTDQPFKRAYQATKNAKTTKGPQTNQAKEVQRQRFKSLEVEELSHDIVKTETDLVTCPICYSDHDESLIVTLPHCHHKFCKECMTSYIKKQMGDFQVLKLQCPQDKCEENLQDAELKIILDAETYEAYQAKKLLKLKNKDIYLRYCPKPGCTKPFYPDNKSQFTTCSCGTVICHGCFHSQHPGKTCVEATAGEFELFAENEDIKTCMICKTASEKRVGCAHVVCPVCDYEWCWNCGREWEPGHGSRCLNKWSPRAPKAFEKGNGRSCFEAFLNALFLAFEIIFFGLSSALVVILIWPCMMSGEIQKNLLKSIKSPGLRKILGVTLAVLSWPVAIIFYPVNAISEEYGGSCRRRRWKKGTSANFGFGNHLAEGRKKFSLSEKEEVKSQPQQENRTEIGLKEENEKIEEIDLEALEGLDRRRSDIIGVPLQKNRSKHNTMVMMVSNNMIPSQMEILNNNNNNPDSVRNVPNLKSNDRRQ